MDCHPVFGLVPVTVFLEDGWVHWAVLAGGRPIPVYVDVVGVEEPQLRMLLVVHIVEVEDLTANDIVIGVYLHNHTVIATDLASGQVAIAQRPRMIHILDKHQPVINPGVLPDILEQPAHRAVRRHIVDHHHLVVRVVLGVQGL